MKFKSQICTTKEQSERLLKLGLKKDTADMRWERISEKYAYYPSTKTPYTSSDIPAWSLHRLIEMVADTPLQDGSQVGMYIEDTYDMVIQGIEWLISRGQFNQDYLEEKKL